MMVPVLVMMMTAAAKSAEDSEMGFEEREGYIVETKENWVMRVLEVVVEFGYRDTVAYLNTGE